MKEIIEGLENIAHAADKGSDLQKTLQEIKGLRVRVGARHAVPLPQLDQELAVWESKIEVIWKEPAGRQGIAKHARHWVEKLKHAG